jgi:photosystem I P700 chlorophyll a apoprotein A2
LYASHAIALGLHISTLILVKGALDARGSAQMPDKLHVGFHFACDGPARSGTCDISAWDSIYLAQFWSLNTGAWTAFYFHWKHITLWQNAAFQFDEGAFYLTAWFRDYLWFNSGALISGYDALGVNDLSVWAWIFLGAHLAWATGFMFFDKLARLLARINRYHPFYALENADSVRPFRWRCLYTCGLVDRTSKVYWAFSL